jgi:hypothetical protein
LESENKSKISVKEKIPSKLMKKHLVYISFLIFLTFQVPLLWFAFWRAGNVWGDTGAERPGQIPLAVGWVALVATAAGFGALGSSIKYFLSPSDRVSIYDESIHAFISMHFIGASFGVLVLLLFMGRLVSGGLFPTFEYPFPSLTPFRLRLDGWGKVMIWSFIGGYNQYFLPNLLDKLMAKKPDDTLEGENKDEETKGPSPH